MVHREVLAVPEQAPTHQEPTSGRRRGHTHPDKAPCKAQTPSPCGHQSCGHHQHRGIARTYAEGRTNKGPQGRSSKQDHCCIRHHNLCVAGLQRTRAASLEVLLTQLLEQERPRPAQDPRQVNTSPRAPNAQYNGTP
jgi:hypothetical protein